METLPCRAWNTKSSAPASWPTNRFSHGRPPPPRGLTPPKPQRPIPQNPSPPLSMNLQIADCRLPIANCLEGRGSWSQCAVDKPWRLSMNLKRLALEMNDLGKTGSWPQLTSGFWRCLLPMNLKTLALEMNDLGKTGSWFQS